MRESKHFTYDGFGSKEKGVHIVSLSGLLDEQFLPNRSIVETKIPNNNKHYLQRMEEEPLEFELEIYLDAWKERDNLREIAQWLFQSYYKPMTFEGHHDRVIYALIVGDTRLLHFNENGYVTLTIRCDSPYIYSFPLQAENADYILNDGDRVVKPKAWIKTPSGGTVVIRNETNEQEIRIDNLIAGEEVFFDFEREEIVSSHQDVGIYRYSDHNDTWLQFEIGENQLSYEGDFTIQYEWQNRYLNFWGD